jgi:hypothetical protein
VLSNLLFSLFDDTPHVRSLPDVTVRLPPGVNKPRFPSRDDCPELKSEVNGWSIENLPKIGNPGDALIYTKKVGCSRTLGEWGELV